MKCEHCGSTFLYRDQDGDLACLCGWRFVRDRALAYKLADVRDGRGRQRPPAPHNGMGVL